MLRSGISRIVLKLVIFYITGLLILLAIDPGWLSWIRSLQYDLSEGEPIIGRALVLMTSTAIVLLPLLTPWAWVRMGYASLLLLLCLVC